MNPREWAIEIVNRLQTTGYQTLWAGGCVRDALLNLKPKDYDVATSATPDEVQELFGAKNTLAIGKSFGVITVIGTKSSGHIEVATFRRDGEYSDGRRPDSVQFTDAKEDALRRDFTINGMFYDPIAEKVIDYVGGTSDLERKLIRAIGDADQRIEEDRLRMLRGVRFAATYGFEIETATMAAINKRAADIESVSPERIGSELRRMFEHKNRARALVLLIKSGLWKQVFPKQIGASVSWERKHALLEQLDSDFSTTLAGLLHETGVFAKDLKELWRLTNEEVVKTDWILANVNSLTSAVELNWSELQPMLISNHAQSAVELIQAMINADLVAGTLQKSVDLCRQKLSLAPSELDPEPLLNGTTLHELGMASGPQFKSILQQVRSLQLDGKLLTPQQARDWVVDSDR